jgi:predicted metal-dependent hydrolase
MIEDLRKAVKLFNRWQFQEAHDAFHQLAEEAEGRDRVFLEGIATIASGFYRIWHKGGEPNAMVSYLERGKEVLKSFDGVFAGIKSEGLVASIDACLEEAARWRRGDSEIFNRDHIPRLEFELGDDD